MAMLRESSTSTAMMFCCGLSSATMIAGCHNKISSSAAIANCNSQITPAFQFRMCGEACGSFDRISQANPPAAAENDQDPLRPGTDRTNSPLEKTARGYLNRNSNILIAGSTLRRNVR